MFRIFNICHVLLCLIFLVFHGDLCAESYGRQVGYSYEDYRDARSTEDYRRYRDNRYGRIGDAPARSVQLRRSERKISSSPKIKKKSSHKKRAVAGRKSTAAKKYTVKKGDTLYSIARKFNTTPAVITRVNSIKNTNRIYAGMVLTVPAGPKNSSSQKKKSSIGAPSFRWPLHKVLSCKRDGANGVNPIGLVIKGRPGAKVMVSEAGTVQKVGHMRGFGRYVVVMHRNRYITVYANISKIVVRKGDSLRRGALIGRIKSGEKLHFQIDHQGKPLNPLKLLPERG